MQPISDIRPRRPEPTPKRRRTYRFWHKKRRVVGILLLLLIALGVGGWFFYRQYAQVVPASIQASVDFPVYYPTDMPDDYQLDTHSFKLAQPDVVVFAVTYGKGNSIAFSEEQPLSSSEMDKFLSNYLPLNSSLQLPVGQAKVGAYGSAPHSRTVVSLPITHGPWLIVSAPGDVPHAALVTMLRSLSH